MFEVRCFSPIDEDWEQRDEEITAAAGRKSDHGGAGHNTGRQMAERDHLWLVPTFDEAQAMKHALEKIQKVTATMQEMVSEEPRGHSRKR